MGFLGKSPYPFNSSNMLLPLDKHCTVNSYSVWIRLAALFIMSKHLLDGGGSRTRLMALNISILHEHLWKLID